MTLIENANIHGEMKKFLDFFIRQRFNLCINVVCLTLTNLKLISVFTYISNKIVNSKGMTLLVKVFLTR